MLANGFFSFPPNRVDLPAAGRMTANVGIGWPPVGTPMSYESKPLSAWLDGLEMLACRGERVQPALEIGVKDSQLILDDAHSVRHFDEYALPPRQISFQARQGVQRWRSIRRRFEPAKCEL